MNGWHYASALLQVTHYFSRGSALCNGQYVPGKFVGMRPPGDACRRCLAKLRPGWGRTRLGDLYHFFDGTAGMCGRGRIAVSGHVPSPDKHCRRCTRNLMRRFSIPHHDW